MLRRIYLGRRRIYEYRKHREENPRNAGNGFRKFSLKLFYNKAQGSDHCCPNQGDFLRLETEIGFSDAPQFMFKSLNLRPQFCERVYAIIFPRRCLLMILKNCRILSPTVQSFASNLKRNWVFQNI